MDNNSIFQLIVQNGEIKKGALLLVNCIIQYWIFFRQKTQ